MNNLEKIGYLCVALVIFLEIGAIFLNLISGESPFYLFNWSEKFTISNGLFFIYWGFLIGCYFLIKHFLFEDNNLNSFFAKFEMKGTIEKDPYQKSIYNPRTNRYEKDGIPAGYKYEIKKEKKSHDANQKIFYHDVMSASKGLSVSPRLDKFLKEKSISLNEFKENPNKWIEEYKIWLKNI